MNYVLITSPSGKLRTANYFCLFNFLPYPLLPISNQAELTAPLLSLWKVQPAVPRNCLSSSEMTLSRRR